MNEFKRIISVCAIQDIKVWKYAAPRILKNLDSEEYLLICPDDQIAEFSEVTPKAWRIAGDDEFSKPFTFSKVAMQVKGFNKKNVGHLFQQFLKINALIDPVLNEDDSVLIWDADTIPLRKIRFCGIGGRLEYFSGVEDHAPYFRTLKSLTGLDKLADRSFIAQCFPTKAGWARDFVGAVSGKKDRNYIQVVLDKLPGDDPESQEFSEYEMMGNWNLKNYPDHVFFRSKPLWYRHGSQVLGPELNGFISRIGLFLLSLRFDFVAFERWEKRTPLKTWLMRLVIKIIGLKGISGDLRK